MAGILRFNADHTNVAFAYNGAPDHFVYFKLCPGLNPYNLQVLVQDTSTDWKTLGPVRETIQLPQIIFPPYARMIVQGKLDNGQPISFIGHLKRGHTYLLDKNVSGQHQLPSFTFANGCSCCAYNTAY